MTVFTPSVVTLGESMIRYSPPGMNRLGQAPVLEMRAAGDAANVAVACARMGLNAAWISKLTDNALGHFIERDLLQHGVNTAHMVWTDKDRVGTYYLEYGAPPRPARVLYDRAHSAFTTLQPDEVNWDVVAGADLFHITGITPGLSPSCAEVTRVGMNVAQQAGILVSFDVNYRERVWLTGERARPMMEECLRLADIAFVASEEARVVFGLRGTEEEVLRVLQGEYGPRIVVLKREDGSSALYADQVYRAGIYPTQTIDPIGTGDAFAAGFIFGFLAYTGDVQRGLDCAAALAALKRTIAGDVALVTRSEVEELLAGGGPAIRR